MTTETTVRVTCDHCGVIHFQGLQKDRPKHAHVTFWSGGVEWDPDDLCEPCAGLFFDMVDDFGKGQGIGA